MTLFLSHCFAAVIGAVLIALVWVRIMGKREHALRFLLSFRNGVLAEWKGHCDGCHGSTPPRADVCIVCLNRRPELVAIPPMEEP